MSPEPVNSNPSIGFHLETTGWLQGAVLSPLDAEVLIPNSIGDDLWIVTTQSCDLVHNSLEEEPFVEVIRAVKLKSEGRNGNFEYQKNPRKLQMDDDCYGLLEVHAKTRVLLGREKLLNLVPYGHLSKQALRSLQLFMRRRYDRAAFASEFNRRKSGTIHLKDESKKQAEKRANQVSDALKRLNSHVYMLLVTGDVLERELMPWEENPTVENQYHFSLICIIKDIADELSAKDCMNSLISSLNSCPGICIENEYDIRTLQELDFLTVEEHIRWDADAISQRTLQPTPTVNQR